MEGMPVHTVRPAGMQALVAKLSGRVMQIPWLSVCTCASANNNAMPLAPAGHGGQAGRSHYAHSLALNWPARVPQQTTMLCPWHLQAMVAKLADDIAQIKRSGPVGSEEGVGSVSAEAHADLMQQVRVHDACVCGGGRVEGVCQCRSTRRSGEQVNGTLPAAVYV
eukprot:1157298-Pelagomonas_calceolata.AAC.30